MSKTLRDRINAVQSQLQFLKIPKLGKTFYDLDKIKELENIVKNLKVRIASIEKVNDTALFVKLDNGETASFHQFGGTIYSTISEGIVKDDFSEFKKDIVKYDWDVDKLREIWI